MPLFLSSDIGLINVAPVTVVCPVGRLSHHRMYFEEFLQSVYDQETLPTEILIIDDGSRKGEEIVLSPDPGLVGVCNVRVHRNEWRLGPAASWNVGVALATNDLVLMCGSDDKLHPECLTECWSAWLKYNDELGWYYLGVRYSNGFEQNLACNASMVHKKLWHHTGGFPPQSAVGAMDHILIGCLLHHHKDNPKGSRQFLGNFYRVSDKTLYGVRVHSNQETASNNIWPAIEAVKLWLGTNWTPYDPVEI